MPSDLDTCFKCFIKALFKKEMDWTSPNNKTHARDHVRLFNNVLFTMRMICVAFDLRFAVFRGCL